MQAHMMNNDSTRFSTKCYATFTGQGGYPSENERARSIFEIGIQYLIIGGKIGKYLTEIKLEGFSGYWNSVMFDFNMTTAPLEHSYINYHQYNKTTKMKLTLKTPQDIPSNWTQQKAKKNTFVTIRDVAPEGEEFSVSWADSKLVADPKVDLVVIQPNGKEYPCKIDIFFETYEKVDNETERKFQKKELSTLVAIPEGCEVEVETLEGKISAVSYPDYVVIGKKDELYANTKEWVDANLTFVD